MIVHLSRSCNAKVKLKDNLNQKTSLILRLKKEKKQLIIAYKNFYKVIDIELNYL